MLIAIELLIIGIGDGLELCLILGHQHGNGIAPEIAARHGDKMHFVAVDEVAKLAA